jgi:hypothetical protein
MFLKYQLKFIGQWEEHTVNANELADMAENACCAYQKEIAAMLRQQQAEIDTYKSQNNNQIDTYRYKELTDEEIEKVFYELDVGHSATDFAKAILRKAQEK